VTVSVRRYQPGEERELWNLRFDTIRLVNCRDYTQDQIQAWAPDEADLDKWQSRIETSAPFVAVYEGTIVGFADLQDSGYIDQFFVHHRWQGKGVGKKLFAAIESDAVQRGFCELTSNVSITARPFFEARGFRVTLSQDVTVGSSVLRNFKMTKSLTESAE
jgi:putative acetyltransferase